MLSTIRLRATRLNLIAHLQLVLWPAILLLALALSTASTQPLDESSAYKGWAVSSFKVRGLDKDLAAELTRGLALSGQSKLFGRRMPTFYPQELQEDIERARLFLARRGYPYAQVNPRIKPSRKSHKVAVTLEVRTGPPVEVTLVSLDGLPPQMQRKVDSSISIKSGSPFSEQKVELTAASIESALKDAGYAKAKVDTTIRRSDSTHVEIGLRVMPGSIYRFNDVTVEGASQDLVPLVKKTVNLKKGSTYSPAKVQEAEDYLRLLSLFGRIRLSTRDAGEQALDLHADLAERKPKTLELNLGYWTDDLLKVSARWYQANLLRAGRGLEIKGAFSRYDQTVGTALNWPGAFGPRTWGLADVTFESQLEQSYNLQSTQLEVAGAYRPTLLTSIRAGISVSDVNVQVKTEEAGAFVDQGGLLTAFSLGWTRDGSNDRLYPTRGSVTSARVEWAPAGSISGSHYISLEGGGSAYVALGKRMVLAARLGAGAAKPLGESVDLLPNKRFYAGGATSMRGFKRRKLGPLDQDGAPLGGEAKLEAGLEFRVNLLWRLGGALFLDTGQVWAHSDHVSLEDVEMATGPGLIVRTPVGPIRVDWGYRLTDIERDQPRSVLHITIGQPF
jgi:outer membrane protein insertion porin family